MSKRPRILFISHDASLSGAPVLLANLVELVQQSGDYSVRIILKRTGSLEHRFRTLGDTLIFRPAGYLKGEYLVGRLWQVLVNRWQLLRCLYYCIGTDFIFSNTITNGRLLRLMRFAGKPVISYVHELDSAVEEHDRRGEVSLTVKHTRIFVWPSEAVKGMLKGRFHIPDARLAFLPYYFPANALPDLNLKTAARKQLAEKFGLQSGHIWIAGMGTASRRKGIDLFIETALQVIRQHAEISFVWIGGYDHADTEAWVKNRLMETEPGRLIITGQLPHNPAMLLPFDCFLLSSREDPYPLVVLEAAACGVPACCFSGSGGITDFVETDAGWQAAYFSVDVMSALLLQAVSSPVQLREKGKRAREKVIDRHFNPENTLALFRAITTQTLQQPGAGK